MFIIAGLYRRHRLTSPKGIQTRPTASRTRESVFNICQMEIAGAQFLDIFAGSGAIGLEALSRGAQSATFIEKEKEALLAIESNIAHLQVKDRCQVLRGDALKMLDALEKRGKKFDILFADPPYCTQPSQGIYYSKEIIQWVDTHSLLSVGGLLFIEEDFRFEPKMETLRTLELKSSRRLGDSVLQEYRKGIIQKSAEP